MEGEEREEMIDGKREKSREIYVGRKREREREYL